MKNLLLCVLTGCLFLTTSLFSFGQCPDDNTFNGFPNPFNPTGPGIGGSITSTNSWGGDYLETTNVVAGNTYTWEVTGTSSFDAAFTLRQQPGGAVLAFDDNTVGQDPRIVWTAGFTGTVRLNIDQMPGCVNNSVHLPVRLSFTSACTPPTVSSNPSPASVCPGATASFTASASGQDSLRWQVSTNGGATWVAISNVSPYSGATTGTLNINPASTGLNGYQYRLMAFACSPAVADSSNAASLTVSDVTNPSITCPSNQTIYVAASCQTSLPDFTGLASTSDNCDPSPVVTQSPAAGNTVSGHNTNVTVSLFSTDASLNSATCTFTTTAIDSTSPNAICQPHTAYLSGGTAVVFAGDIDGGSTDNCTVGGLSSSPAVFSCAELGANTVVLTVNDAAGNTDTCHASVTIADTSGNCCAIAPNGGMISIDGESTESEWDTLASKQNSNNGFNNGTVLEDILYRSTCDTLYLAVRSTVTTGANDGIGLWLDLGSTSGATAGTNLGFNNGSAHYIGNTTAPNFRADFEVDYMFAWNSGTSASNMFVDAGRPGVGTQFLGNCGQSGVVAANAGGAVFGASTVRFSYNSSSCFPAMEIAIPWSQLGGYSNTVNAFAFEVSNTGFFSDQTIPGTLSGNAGANPNFGALATGPFNAGYMTAGAIFVDSSATGNNDGTSWADAFTDFQSALSCSGSGDSVLVAKGTYKPSVGGSRSQENTFSLVDGVKYFGGFPNGGGNFASRNFTANRSVLSGDIGVVGDSTDNNYVVVNASGLSASTYMGGFTVEHGNADTTFIGGPIYDDAGGMVIGTGSIELNAVTFRNNTGRFGGGVSATSGTPVFRACTFQQNHAFQSGGGALNISSGTPTVVSCDFSNNIANAAGGALSFGATAIVDSCTFLADSSGQAGGAINGNGTLTVLNSTFTNCKGYQALGTNHSGGAIYMFLGQLLVDNCVFEGNMAHDGGAIRVFSNSTSIIRNSEFTNNRALSQQGGAVYILNGTDSIVNSIFCKNTAAGNGGAIYRNNAGTFDIVHCSFSGNESTTAAGGFQNNSSSVCTVKNSIFWGNTTNGSDASSSTEIQNGTGSVTVTNTIWQGGGGVTIYNADPLWTDAANCDLTLTQCSPAIDTGATLAGFATDFAGNARVDARPGGLLHDLGAYEYQSLIGSTLTLSVSVDSNATCPNSTDGGLTANASGGLAPYTYLWNNGDTTASIVVGAGTYTVTVTDNNGAGCVIVDSATVTGTDTTAPVITCPANISVAADGSCQANPAFMAMATDNCDTSVAISYSQSSGFGLGTTAVTAIGTDDSGNSDTCSFSVTVIDSTAPAVTCPANITVAADTACQASPAFMATATDACDTSVTITYSQSSGFGLGTTTVTATGTDDAGNAGTCSFSVTVNDSTAPVITCPSNINTFADGSCQANPSLAATATDACDTSVTITYSQSSGFGLGTTTVTATGTDDAGNSANCTFSVTVTDSTSPVITCPANISVAADASCQANPTFMATATDACDTSVAITYSQSSGFGLGTTTVTATGTDDAGNTANCTFSITVIDSTAPVVTCPGNIGVAADTACQASPAFMATATDACDTSVTITYSHTSGFGLGTTTVTATGTDDAGNAGTCTFSVTVDDSTAPVISCPSNINAFADGSCQASPSFAATATDACDTSVTITYSQSSGFGLGTTTVTATGTDDAGNSANCTFSVTVTDSTSPVITCPANISVAADASCQANPAFMATATDACDTSVAITYSATGPFGQGTTTVTATGTDDAGNTASCTFTVSVIDSTAPTITCPANISVAADSANCQAVVNFPMPGVSDNCSVLDTILTTGEIAFTGYQSDGTDSFSFVLLANIKPTDTIFFTDNGWFAAGGFRGGETTIAWVPGTAMMCGTEIWISGLSANMGTVTGSPLALSTSGDQIFAYTGTEPTIGNESNFLAAIQMNSVWDADATSSNTSAQPSGFTDGVNSISISPERDNAAYNCVTTTGSAGTLASAVNNSANWNSDDNLVPAVSIPTCGFTCTGSSGLVINQIAGLSSGSGFATGTTTNTFSVTDDGGNSDTCSFTVTVSDSTAPVITCPSNITAFADGSCQANPVLAATATDACDTSVTITYSQSSGFGLGTTTVTATGTDDSGNAATCTFSVTVTDTTSPTISCPANMSVNADSTCQAFPTFMATATDACDTSVTVTYSQNSGTAFSAGITTVTATGTDDSGNSSSCSFTVTVTDVTAPVAICRNDTIIPDTSGMATVIAAGIDGGSTDNCGVDSIWANPMMVTGLGNHTITLMVADSSGNIDSCSATVTVIDTVPPTAICISGYAQYPNVEQTSGATTLSATNAVSQSFRPNMTGDLTQLELRVSQQGGSALNVSIVNGTNPAGPAVATATIPAASASLTNYIVNFGSPAPVVAGNDYTIVIDDGGNPSSLAAAAANGNPYPDGNAQFNSGAWINLPLTDMFFRSWVSFVGPADTLYLDSLGGASISAADVDNGSFDNAGPVSIALSDSTFDCSDLGNTETVSLIVTDVYGNQDSCQIDVIILDSIGPNAVCNDTTLYLDSAGTASVTAAGIDNGSWDNCPIASLVISQSSWTCADTGVNVVTLTVTDSNGATDNCTSNVTVLDTITPDITCPSNMTVSNDTGVCGATLIWMVSTSDNCSGDTLVQTSGLPSGSVYPIGTTTNAFTVTDASGNTASCSFDITVNDTEVPVISCPNDTTLNNDIGVCGAAFSYAVLASDNCAGDTTIQTNGLTSGSTFPVGATLNSFLVTDASGNADSCSFTVTVLDVEAPVASCPSNIITNTDPGQCDAVVSFTVNGTDNCPGDTLFLTAGLASGGAFPKGITTNIFVAEDAAGNTDTCSFTVEVIDNEAPVISCPSDTTINNDAGQCDAVYSYLISSTDNCPGDIVTQTLGLSSGAAFPVGVTSMAFLSTDAVGNTDSCSFNVTVLDAEAPITVCPSDTVISTDAGLCSAVHAYTVTSSDNCGDTLFQTTGLMSGSAFPKGVTLNTWMAVDTSGNVDSCSFTVTVEDNEAPVITCPANITVNNDSTLCSAVVNFSVTATDNCPADTVIQTGGLASGSAFPVFAVTTNTFMAVDSAGNTDTCSFTVTVVDAEAPIIVCPSNIVVANDTGICGAVVNYTAPTTSDNCPGQTMVQTAGLGAGSTFPVGVTTETYQVTDLAGNTADCSFTVTVNDNEAPVIVCPSDTVMANDPGQCSAIVTFAAPVGVDNCAGATTAQTGGLPSGTTYPVGSITNTFTVTDTSGNTSTCSFTITVQDQEAPILTCPANSVVANDTGICGAVVNYPLPNIQENCVVDSLILIGGLGSGALFPTGITVETYLVSDTAGNVDSCSFSIEVLDLEAPVITCPGNDTLYADTACAAILPDYTSLISTTDNCDPSPVVAQLPSGGSTVTGAGTLLTVSISSTDTAGNVGICTLNVLLLDTIAPVVVCPANDTVFADTACMISLNDYTGMAIASDNCTASPILTQNPGVGTMSSGAGTVIPVTLTAADSSGNLDSCSFTVTILDTTPPVFTCPADTFVIAGASCTASLPDFTATTSISDNCDAAPVLSQSPVAGTTLTGYSDSVVVWLTGLDASGNADSCSFVVSMTDTIAPVINCPANIMMNTDTAVCGAVVNYGFIIASDNCGSPVLTMTSGLTTGSTFPAGVTVVAFTAVDSTGNADSCSFTVTVNDNEAPVLAPCPADTILSIDSTQCGIAVSWPAIGISDNCGIDSLFMSHSNGDTFYAGVDTVMVMAWDSTGNMTSCEFTVTVNQPVFTLSTSAFVYPNTHNVSCNGSSDGSATATVSGGCLPYSYSWSNGGTTDVIGGLAAGTYSVTVTDGFGRMLVDTLTLTEPAAIPDSLITIVGGSAFNCAGDTVMLMAPAGYSMYFWSTGSLNASIDVTTTAWYSVEVTDSFGCTGLDSVYIEFQSWTDPLPVITPNGNITLCDGDSLLLDVGGGYFQYEWSNGDTTRSTTVTTSGAYWVTVYNGFGCSRTSATVNVTVVPNPTAPVVTQSNDTLTSTPAFSYQWYMNNDSLLVGAENQTYVMTATGTYYVVITDSNGCTAQSNIIDFTVGIGEGEMGDELNIYPNPFTNRLNIELRLGSYQKVDLQIVDMLGQVIFEEPGDQVRSEYVREIDLGSVANGIYYVRLKAGDQKWIHKVVKQ